MFVNIIFGVEDYYLNFESLGGGNFEEVEKKCIGVHEFNYVNMDVENEGVFMDFDYMMVIELSVFEV